MDVNTSNHFHITFPIRSDKLTMTVAFTEQITTNTSPFQTIDIYETTEFGKMLFLDGHVQLAEFDEHAYHESFAHLPLSGMNNPTSVLIVGGGDGAMLRELCKHKSLTTIHMVEIDDLVVETCKQHLPDLNAGAFDDPRVTLMIEDAFPFIKNPPRKYDAIYIDATDVYEEDDGSLSEQLFTNTFYQDCCNALTEQGIVVTQADNPVFCPYSAGPILEQFRAAFGNAGFYWCLVPSFGGYSGFVWGSPNHTPAQTKQLPTNLNLKYLNDLHYSLALSPIPFGELAK
jgi:spermidine synthase